MWRQKETLIVAALTSVASFTKLYLLDIFTEAHLSKISQCKLKQTQFGDNGGKLNKLSFSATCATDRAVSNFCLLGSSREIIDYLTAQYRDYQCRDEDSVCIRS